MSKTAIGFDVGIVKKRRLINMFEKTGKDLTSPTLLTANVRRHINAHSIARLIDQRSRRKVGAKSVRRSYRIDDEPERYRRVCRRQGIKDLKINFILSRSFFMMRILRLNSHLLECQANLPSKILALIERRDIHIARVIVGRIGAVAVIIRLEEIELHLGLKVEPIALLAGIFHGAAQQGARIRLDRFSVGIAKRAEHTDHLAVLGPQREDGNSIRFGMKPNVYSVIAAETRNVRSVDRIALFERSVELGGLDGYILLYAENIAKSKADELNVLFLDILHDLVFFRCHGDTLFN